MSGTWGNTRRPRARPEDIVQRHIVSWLRLLGPRLEAVYFHCPNGGARSPTEGAIFKGLGVTAGAPDLVFLWGTGCGCLEVKARDGRQSESQRAFQLACHVRGIPYVVVRDIDEAQKAVNGWGIVRPVPVWRPPIEEACS